MQFDPASTHTASAQPLAPNTTVQATKPNTSTPTVRLVDAGDVGLQISANQTFSNYKWQWGVECDGVVRGAVDVPETGISGSDLGGTFGSLRFGKTADPEAPRRKVILFRANMNDAYVSGAPRCEATFSPNFNGRLPVGKDFWFGFGVRLQDWTPAGDEQLLMQWHWSNGTIPLQPFLALYLKAGKLELVSRSDVNSPPSTATAQATSLWQDTVDMPSNRWIYFTIKARISHDTRLAPSVKVWRDGQAIVNYSGPVGYNYPGVTPYAKVGHYQWVASYNPWTVTAPTKTVLYRAPSLVNDTTGKYSEPDIRSFVLAN